jgi:hypothetical protein
MRSSASAGPATEELCGCRPLTDHFGRGAARPRAIGVVPFTLRVRRTLQRAHCDHVEGGPLVHRSRF